MNKLKYLFICCLVLYSFSSCVKDYITLNKAILVNETAHDISIFIFKKGGLANRDSIAINAHDSVVILQGTSKGEKAGVDWQGATGAFKNTGDSVIVIFDNNFPVTHYYQYSPESIYRAEKYYLFSSSRNVLNLDNFILNQEKLTKHKYENILRYRFAEQDYEYAKD